MKPINIYELTRVGASSGIQKLERQMSGRAEYLKIKKWEIDSLRAFVDRLNEVMTISHGYEFYYSFLLPKLGKEFDLLRISSDYIINIELKSRPVSTEAIKKQLIQNRYYLSMLGKTIYSYTYISSENRLVRLSNTDKIIDSDWQTLTENLQKQTEVYSDDIEVLFKEDKYIISPLTDPDRFLRKEYFLTSQQKDIERKILGKLKNKGFVSLGFSGSPGTGKSLLLYDIAMKLSVREKVCVVHIGGSSEELSKLNNRLKRVDFIATDLAADTCDEQTISDEYTAICVDEAHRITKEVLDNLCEIARKRDIPIIFSYATEALLGNRKKKLGSELIEELKDCQIYQLTNRIRVNSEISAFVHNVIKPLKYKQQRLYPSVKLAYANDEKEAGIILDNYKKNGYVFIYDNRISKGEENQEHSVEVTDAVCREFERVVMMIDDTFYYNSYGSLDAFDDENYDNYKVRCLFHGLSRAKEKVTLIVVNNIDVFNVILSNLQK